MELAKITIFFLDPKSEIGHVRAVGGRSAGGRRRSAAVGGRSAGGRRAVGGQSAVLGGPTKNVFSWISLF